MTRAPGSAALRPDALVVQRGLLVVAAAATIEGINGYWQVSIARSAVWGSLFGTLFAVLLALGVWACVCRTQRVADRLGVAVLVAAIVARATPFVQAARGRTRYSIDETTLLHLASRAVAHGHDPYTRAYPALHGATMLMNGTTVDRYPYPGLVPLLGGALARILPGSSETVVLAYLTLALTAVLMFALLPRRLRPLAVIVVFAVGPLPFMVQQGYSTLFAMPLLLVAVWHWPLVGRGGRLRRRGVVQAVALGLAAATQQLVWFAVPFLVVGLWRVRRGELERRPAAWVTIRYAAVTALAFAVPNLPFVIAGPGSWWRGVLTPLRQHALFDGPGIMTWSWRVIGHSGALDWYAWAGLLLLATLLGATALYPRQLLPAAVALPWPVFWLALRSETIYYTSFLVVIAFSVAVNRPSWFAGARPVTLPRLPRLPTGRLRAGLPAAGGLLVAAALLVALVSPAPLRVTVAAVDRSGRYVTALRVVLRNTTGSVWHPSFVTNQGSRPSRFWLVVSGPGTLGPHRTASYLLRPTTEVGRPTRLWVVTDDPQTLSTGRIR